VELANMNRLFFRPDQAGMTKTDAAAQTLGAHRLVGIPAPYKPVLPCHPASHLPTNQSCLATVAMCMKKRLRSQQLLCLLARGMFRLRQGCLAITLRKRKILPICAFDLDPDPTLGCVTQRA